MSGFINNMKTILGYITFLLLLPFMWIRLRQKKDNCIICLRFDDHECIMCGEMISKKECKYQDGCCKKCVSDCCDVV